MTKALSAPDFAFLRERLAATSGMLLEDARQQFVETRLLPLANEEGAPTLDDLLARLRREPVPALWSRVIEALTVHETRFFRDVHAFEALEEKILPELIAARHAERSLSIWCAACSTGQEPYSVAMVIKSSFPELLRWRVRIVASDLSANALARARLGRYTRLEISRCGAASRVSPWLRPAAGGELFEVAEPVRRLLEFRELNLAARPWPRLPQFDLILLRNVLIYFGADTRARILGGVRAQLRQDGTLLMGSGEMPTSGSGFDPSQVGRALVFRPSKGTAPWIP